jgi:hypothetical protein
VADIGISGAGELTWSSAVDCTKLTAPLFRHAKAIVFAVSNSASSRVDVPRNSLTTAVQNSMLVPPSLLRPFDRWARCHGPDVADLVGKLDQLGGMALVPRGRLAFIARSNGAAGQGTLSGPPDGFRLALRADEGASFYETRYCTRVVENLHRHAKAFGFVLQPMRAS